MRRSATSSPRWADAVILANQPTKIARASDVSLEGNDVIVVQTKARRLSMTLMGQVVFSIELLRRSFDAASVRGVALCRRDDAALHPLLDDYPDIEVVVVPDGVDPPRLSYSGSI